MKLATSLLVIPAVGLLLASCKGPIAGTIAASDKCYKPSGNSNPVSSVVFCADPTAVEYDGRLYVYGTNDHQQYLNAANNTYEKIKSLVCFSTEDMVNWTYHGIINTEKIAPWIINSWAPSIVSRQEEDGLTHFYLYFSNNGCGVGVITSTDPLGPWSDPLGRPLIHQGQPEIGDCPNPFDPGVCIDGNGVGWLAFGGGTAKDGNDEMPGSTRIARMNGDMVSLAQTASIPAPYFFEASELNFINGKYVYTSNNNWMPRNPDTWDYPGIPMPSRCSMAYMTTDTPLDPESWEYKGHYFLNPGDSGMEDSNNHTHIHKYKGEYYILSHSQLLLEYSHLQGGFRSLMVDKLDVDEDNLTIGLTGGSRKGVEQTEPFDPSERTSGTTMFSSADIRFVNEEDPSEICSEARADGAWIMIKNVDFSRVRHFQPEFGISFSSSICSGSVEVRLDAPDGETIAALAYRYGKGKPVSRKTMNPGDGCHDVYILLSSEGMRLKSWSF